MVPSRTRTGIAGLLKIYNLMMTPMSTIVSVLDYAQLYQQLPSLKL